MSSFQIELQAEYELADELKPSLISTAIAALEHQSVAKDSELTLLFTDDETLKQLNRDYRGIDKTTDVLSFTDGDPTLPGELPYLGDIAISVPQASRQAISGGHELLAELQLLVAHGILHLCGHDHVDKAEKAIMWRAQQEILAHVGAAVTVPVLPHEPSN